MKHPTPLHPSRSGARFATLASVLLALMLGGCGHRSDAKAQVKPVAVPKPPTVTDAEGPFILRYFSPTSGQLIAVHKRSEVPAGARHQVIVVPEDPNLQGPWLFVADLTKKKGKSYAVRAVDRLKMEQQVAAAHPAPKPQVASAKAPGASADGKNDEVTIYRTAWCGYCKKAAQYLRLKGVPFVEKDIERDPGARQEMLRRAAAAGVPPSQLQGVPIIIIHGHVIDGFSREAIDRALGG